LTSWSENNIIFSVRLLADLYYTIVRIISHVNMRCFFLFFIDLPFQWCYVHRYALW